MTDLSKTQEIIREELQKLTSTVLGNLHDPIHRQQAMEMASDLALLPLRLARGEDVGALVAALRAEAANRTLEVRTEAETAALRAWISIAQRLIIGAVTSAIA